MNSSRPRVARPGYPSRIVCLTEETTEILYTIGAGELVVGVSGYTVRPSEARLKPKVSAFISANYDKVMALSPEVVLAFSDLQADITRELIKRGVTVFTFNQRSIEEILTTIRVVGAVVGYHEEAEQLANKLQRNLDEARLTSMKLARRPRVYFEEWDDPMISGIRWVTELIEVAGGNDIFPELRDQSIATGRIVTTEQVVTRDPEIILASWCGKKVRPERIATRPGFESVTAVRASRIHEIKSSTILQPGPAALSDGLTAIQKFLSYHD